MTLGCEAFAVGVDDPAEVYGDAARRPGAVRPRPRVGDRPAASTRGSARTRYEVPVQRARRDPRRRRAHRLRRHRASATTRWGVRDWWTLGWVWTAGGLEDGTRFHATRIRGSATTRCYATGLRSCRRAGRCASDLRRSSARSTSASTASPSGLAQRGRPRPGDRAAGLPPGAPGRRPTAGTVTPASPGRCAASRPPTAGPAWAGREWNQPAGDLI